MRVGIEGKVDPREVAVLGVLQVGAEGEQQGSDQAEERRVLHLLILLRKEEKKESK